MTANEIIAEIESLPPTDQLQVIRFAYRLDAERQLTGDEIAALAEKMTECSDPVEAVRIREEIVRGFYGTRSDA
jgi:hypothetical protein